MASGESINHDPASAIDIRGLSFSYRSQDNSPLILDNISLVVPKGEFIAILGISGCGKTTLLHCIAGFVKAQSGQILVNGRSAHGVSENIGFIFQTEALFPWKTIYKNISSGSRISKLSRRERTEKVRQVADKVGILDALDLYPHQLSGGMAQRAEIARALANSPDILLMDEPFSKTDVQTRQSLQFFLQDLWLNLNQTVVFVTHDVEEALILADRIIILSGKPARVGEVIRNPLPRPRTLASLSEPSFNESRMRIMKSLEEDYKRLKLL